MLAWEYPPRIIGGLARVVWALSHELAELGLDVHVITADHPATPEFELDGKVKVHRVKTQTDSSPDFLTWVSKLNFGFLQYAIPLFNEQKFDIIHAHDWMVTDAAWVLKTTYDTPLVTTIHATEQGRMGGIHTGLQRYVHQMEWRLTYESFRVIVNSHHMVDELRNSFDLPRNKIDVIPNGVTPENFRIDFPENEKRAFRQSFAGESQKIVLYVGRLVNEKGVQVLIDAAPKVIQQYPETQFLIVGTGYFMETLKAQADYLGVTQNVRFLGYVADSDLLKLYQITDVVAIPSLYEPFGIVALEGMAAGTPVVVSDVGGLRDFVEHMQNGITTYAGNSDSLAWGILQVLRDPGLAHHLNQTATKAVEEVYNWKMITKKTQETYENVFADSKQDSLLKGGSR
ncbi:glycosyltransferase family 4 protein [bacterium]|nr:glycosyltransferase family 4 protein [bacterium]QQR60111.1 MAG: glycosyltransferase family 4 protein [Candidatus Melainabacteria bacterium]